MTPLKRTTAFSLMFDNSLLPWTRKVYCVFVQRLCCLFLVVFLRFLLFFFVNASYVYISIDKYSSKGIMWNFTDCVFYQDEDTLTMLRLEMRVMHTNRNEPMLKNLGSIRNEFMPFPRTVCVFLVCLHD